MSDTLTTHDVPALLALTEAGVPSDVVELLVRGDPMRGIAPGALHKAITAAMEIDRRMGFVADRLAPHPMAVAIVSEAIGGEIATDPLSPDGVIVVPAGTVPPVVSFGGWPTFQRRVHAWMLACFGEEIAADGMERNHRFLEEALELVQANGCTASEAHQLVDYVFGREVGEVNQEAGGVAVTLVALLNALGVDLIYASETELARVWTKVEQIRAKQAAKPKHSPLPQ